jgi:hypothetical protein
VSLISSVLFSAHYDERCFLPIHIYEGTTGKPVAMILREGKTPSGKEVLEARHQAHPQPFAQGRYPGARRQSLQPRRSDGMVRKRR